MRVTGSRAYTRPTPTPKMPPGLVELMEGLTKDVLKNNPEDVYEFCAEHMQKLLDIRDGAPSKKQMSLEQKIKNAQEKIRQKIQNRRLQEEVNKRSNKTLEQGESIIKLEPVREISLESTGSSRQPVHHGEHMVMAHDEMEISHEPNVKIATTDTNKQEVFEERETVSKSTVQSADSNNVKEEVEETRVDIKEGKPVLSETLPNKTLTNKLEEDLKRSSVEIIESELVISLAPADSNNVKEKVEETNVDVKEGLPILSETLPNETLTNKLDEDLKRSNVEIIESELVISLAPADSNNVKEEVEETNVDVKQGLPILSETLQNETLTNKLDEDLKISSVEIIESELVISLAHESDGSINEVKQEEEVVMVANTPLTSETPQNDKEIKMDAEIKESTSGRNTKALSDIGQVNNAQQILIDDENTVRDPPVTIRHDLFLLDSKETFKPNELIVDDIDKMNSKDEVQTIAVDSKTVDEEVTKNHSNENGVISFQQQNETVDNEILSDKLKPATIKNNAINSDSENSKNENDNEPVKSNESNIETNHPESLLECQLVKTIIEEQQLGDKKLEPEAETGEPVQFVEGHKRSQGLETERNGKIANTGENLDNSKDEVNGKHQNDFDIPKNESNIIDTVVKLLDQERQYSSELLLKENEVFLDTSLINDGVEIKIDSDESTENQAGSGMDLETAAVTIQKVFRTFMFSKSRASTLEDTVNENYGFDEEIDKKDEPEYVIPSASLNKDRRALGLSRMDTVLQTVNEEKSLSLSTDDSSTLSSAATTIQAQVRGFLVRNKLASYKTASASSLVNSEGQSTVSLESDTNEPKKTILNIHIVPERGQFMSRDESMLTSIDLPLDNSPLSSVNLHPLGYDKSEPRKQLKREDAIQSVSPPSNNSGKLSEEVDSVKDPLIENSLDLKPESGNSHPPLASNDKHQDFDAESCDTTLTISSTADTVIEAETYNAREVLSSPEHNSEAGTKDTVTNFSSDEMDVVTPFPNIAEKTVSSQETAVDEKPKLVHTGEFHDLVVQTQVKRSESSVIREFKNVLVYFLLWDK